jgi:hypothetical protein
MIRGTGLQSEHAGSIKAGSSVIFYVIVDETKTADNISHVKRPVSKRIRSIPLERSDWLLAPVSLQMHLHCAM